jgi:uncharacterized protein
MKRLSKIISAAGLVVGLALAAGLAGAQQQAAPAATGGVPVPKPGTAAAMAAAREVLQLKAANAMYAGAVPGLVEKTKNVLLQNNLNYQKDLNEVAVVVAQKFAGREKEIGEGMAAIYTQSFSEQELKDLVVFYKSPLGQKLLTAEPGAVNVSLAYMQQWASQCAEIINGEFRAEMRKRGKEI